MGEGPSARRLQIPQRSHARGLACGRSAVALRRPVAARAERHRVCRLRDFFRALPQEALSARASRGAERHARRPARQARARRPRGVQRGTARGLPRDHPVPRAGAHRDGDPRAAHLPHHRHRPRKEDLMKKRTMDASLAEHSPKLIRSIERRLFLTQGLSLGALALLSGCALTDDEGVQGLLLGMSRWNDSAQAWLFNPNKLAPEYPESAITKPFPFNAYYGEDEVRLVDGASYKLELSGLIRDKKPWTLPELYALPQTSQITRHICVEGWSAIGKWSGVRFSDFLARVGADTTAKYFAFAADTTPGKPMRMDEPMHGEMKKKNMKKGDVKKAAEKKAREMKPMMEKEAAGAQKR